MTAEKVIVDADLWEWLSGHARHADGCWGEETGSPPYTCGCGFYDIALRLLTAAVPVEEWVPVRRTDGVTVALWAEVTR